MTVDTDHAQGVIVLSGLDIRGGGDVILTQSQAARLGSLLLRRAAELPPAGRTDDPNEAGR